MDEKKKKRIDKQQQPEAEKMQAQNKSGLAATSEFFGNVFSAKLLEGGDSASTKNDVLEPDKTLVRKS